MAKKILIALLAVVCLTQFFTSEKWSNQSVIQGDAYGYYAYLPAVLVYQDLSFEWQRTLPADQAAKYWLYEGKAGHQLPKMTIGLALIWTPAVVMAHTVAKMFNADTGWSMPYQLAVGFSGITFLLLGCWQLYLFLHKRFSGFISAITILLLVVGTNLNFYAVYGAGMGHVYSFALLALLLHHFENWLTQKSFKSLVVWSVALGTMVLIRPTNVIVALIPLFWWLAAKSHRISGLQLLIAVVCGGLPMFLQMVFWKYATGNWLYYSYGEEQIFWANPHIINGLFSYRNGWFVYTPLAVIAIVALLIKALKRDWDASSFLVVLALHVYITFSWWCWYYGDSLSIRPMIDVYALLALGLAYALQWIIRQGLFIHAFFMLLFGMLIWNNQLQISQYHKGVLTGSTMSKAAFWALFLETDPPKHMIELGMYQHPDNDNLRKGLPERVTRDTIIEKEWILNEFDQLDDSQIQDGKSILKVDKNREYSGKSIINTDSFFLDYDRYLEVEYLVKSHDYEKAQALIIAEWKHNDLNYGYHTIELGKMDLTTDWERVRFYFKRPKYLPDSAEFSSFLWVRGKEEVWIDRVVARQIDCPYRVVGD